MISRRALTKGAIFSLLFLKSQSAYALPVISCRNLRSITANPEKRKYIKMWANKSVNDDNFVSKFNVPFYVKHRNNEELFRQFGPDFAFIGIDRKYAKIRLNRDRNKIRDTSIAVQSVSIAEGRNSIVVRVNNSPNLGLYKEEEVTDKLYRIDPDVFVYCR